MQTQTNNKRMYGRAGHGSAAACLGLDRFAGWIVGFASEPAGGELPEGRPPDE